MSDTNLGVVVTAKLQEECRRTAGEEEQNRSHGGAEAGDQGGACGAVYLESVGWGKVEGWASCVVRFGVGGSLRA